MTTFRQKLSSTCDRLSESAGSHSNFDLSFVRSRSKRLEEEFDRNARQSMKHGGRGEENKGQRRRRRRFRFEVDATVASLTVERGGFVVEGAGKESR